MKRKAAELKCIARGNLTRHYGVPMGAMVVSQLIQTIPLLFFSRNLTGESTFMEWLIYYLAAFVLSLLGVILAMGNTRIAIQIARGQEHALKDLFYSFTRHPDKYILLSILLSVLMILCTLPGIGLLYAAKMTGRTELYILAAVLFLAAVVAVTMVSLVYSQSMILLLDCGPMKMIEAMRESRKMMRGNIGRLFYLGLSFVGWKVLGAISFGVGFLWITPYINETTVMFYMDITGECDRIQKETVRRQEEQFTEQVYRI